MAIEREPGQILDAFRKHIALGSGEGPRSGVWLDTYNEHRWRFAESIRVRPELCDRLREAAVLHLSNEVKALLNTLENKLLAACRVLSMPRARPKKAKRRRVRRLPAVDPNRLAVIEQRARESCDLLAGPQVWPMAARAVERLNGVEGVLSELNYICDKLNKTRRDQFAQAAKQARKAAGAVRGVLLEGRRAELWRASNRVLHWYYGLRPPPHDESFGYNIGRPWRPVSELVCLTETLRTTPPNEPWNPHQKALETMEIVTEYVCQDRVEEGRGEREIRPPAAQEPPKPIVWDCPAGFCILVEQWGPTRKDANLWAIWRDDDGSTQGKRIDDPRARRLPKLLDTFAFKGKAENRDIKQDFCKGYEKDKDGDVVKDEQGNPVEKRLATGPGRALREIEKGLVNSLRRLNDSGALYCKHVTDMPNKARIFVTSEMESTTYLSQIPIFYPCMFRHEEDAPVEAWLSTIDQPLRWWQNQLEVWKKHR